ncbi:response regulator [Sorangium sp. So ce327]|jgi:PleD family two-component response regulator|uniref:response regulator n=1 Tax=unclassified Sorangium TaxID=2621164 RepID=UPI003F604B5C
MRRASSNHRDPGLARHLLVAWRASRAVLPPLERAVMIRVLVIDDDEIAREAMRAVLVRAGFDVVELATPIGATAVIKRDKISVVALDINMPTINGDKLAKLLRDNAQLSNLGIVLVSSCDIDKLSAIGEKVGADGIVSKAKLHVALAPAVERAVAARAGKTSPPPPSSAGSSAASSSSNPPPSMRRPK